MISSNQIKFFDQEGYLELEKILSEQDIVFYSKTYDAFINNEFDTTDLRSDLSGKEDNDMEYITQIMLPSKIYPDLLDLSMHQKSLAIAQQLLGQDMILDFDMLINKAPYTNQPTPWHQDAAYWIDMPDKRALSIWFAIDEATLENGCMWYTPKSHQSPLREHFQPLGKGALQCSGSENESIAVPLKPGSCAIHHGHTLHYSRGNNTSRHRRAFILNFRPKKMVELERAQGMDHSGNREVRN
jgi:phytanoyl-CoA hydroxylase